MSLRSDLGDAAERWQGTERSGEDAHDSGSAAACQGPSSHVHGTEAVPGAACHCGLQQRPQKPREAAPLPCRFPTKAYSFPLPTTFSCTSTSSRRLSSQGGSRWLSSQGCRMAPAEPGAPAERTQRSGPHVTAHAPQAQYAPWWGDLVRAAVASGARTVPSCNNMAGTPPPPAPRRPRPPGGPPTSFPSEPASR